MSLRLRLTLGFVALMLLLAASALAGLHALTRDLDQALGESAASVGRSVVAVLRQEVRRTLGGAGQREVEVEHHVVRPAGDAAEAATLRLRVDGRELDTSELAQRLAAAPPARIELRREQAGEAPMLWLHGPVGSQPIPLPRSGVQTALEQFSQRLLLGLAALLLIGVAATVWLTRRATRPLVRLEAAADAVAHGALGTQAPETGPPEIRRCLAAFNRMSAQLQRLDAEAAALRADRELAELGEIGRGLAHSLRNPLHALGLSLEALASRLPGDGDAPTLSQAGREQLARIDQALRGFLALAAGADAEPEPVALAEVVDDVLLEASQRAAGRVRFVREGDAPRLRGVAAELRILLHTLVVNALEASPDGGSVGVRLGVDGEAVRIEVEDEGPGLPEGVRARLFAPHVSSKPAGAGMGLYLAERLARLRYRGRLELLPRTPQGTLARLVLHDREARDGR